MTRLCGTLAAESPRRGILYALSAAVLFGASAPFAKSLLGTASPQGMAGLLYVGSGIGMALVRALRPGERADTLKKKDLPWLSGSVLAGGAAAPILLMNALQRMPASEASLLLNLEAVFTALIAWLLFKEKFSARVGMGLIIVIAGGILLGWHGSTRLSEGWGPALVAGACVAWGFDNNFMERISRSDALQIAMIKGLVAGSVNILIALALDATWPSASKLGLAATLGFFGYGISLVLFVMALRRIGATRTIAAFSMAPFVGTIVGVAVFGEPLTWLLAASGALMALGVAITATAPRDQKIAPAS